MGGSELAQSMLSAMAVRNFHALYSGLGFTVSSSPGLHHLPGQLKAGFAAWRSM
jgi:hypothetical protein